MNLSGHKILVTGASRGIGRACAELLAELGARIVLVARNADRLEAVCSSLPGGPHQVIPLDMLDTERIPELFQQACQDGVKFTGLVHAAGTGPVIPAKMITMQAIQEIFIVNYFSFMLMVRQFIRRQYSDGGSIVAISSVAGSVGWPGVSLYGGSKGALDASVKSLAIELAGKFRINSVVPSNIETDMLHSLSETLSEDVIGEIAKKQPLGIGKPRDVANFVAFLLSENASFITGSNLAVDGGFLAGK